ncbi:hypothetical protein J8A71_00945 [Mycoplasmopsis agalactiae]|uniref:MAG1890 family putative lipoprotein n=1 Tax=Mycoplasmopsis agalactiae TaxID=2110 RepID=UPI001F2AE84D|nr:hypothetical protein [Mycoplasmopsis agalactiae]MCE6061477.1 hypothetical protein [Mycoplasmopsis agalactiae]
MKKLNTKIPLLSKLVLKTGIFITPPLLISASCYSQNEKPHNITFDVENKGAKLSSDITLSNINDHVKISKPEHIKLEFVSVTQRNNSLEVEYRIINKDKSKTLPKKVLITGFKDTISNGNSAINPSLVPPINKKELEDNKDQKDESQENTDKLKKSEENSPKYSESLPDNKEKSNSESKIDRTIKETGYRLNELTAYTEDLFTIDEDADKAALAQKLDNAINSTIRSKTPGAIAIVRGLSRPKSNWGWLDGLSTNQSLKPEIKERINTHTSEPTLGFFFSQVEKGISVWWHGDRKDKKYLLRWRLIKEDGKPGDKVYSQIIDLS